MENKFLKSIQKEILIPILNDYASRRGALADLARKLEAAGLMCHAKNRLAELRSGDRTLTFYYLNACVRGELMTIAQILRGRKIENLNAAEKDTVLRLMADPKELELLYEAKRDGEDPAQLLRIRLKKP